MTERTQFAIAGGGLAGWSLAWRLVEEGAAPSSILVVDSGREDRGSGNPGALFHPFPGNSIAPDDRRLRRARSSISLIEDWRDQFDAPPIREFPLVRPVTDDERGTELADSWAGADDYPDWLQIRRLSGRDLADLDDRLAGWDDAFRCSPAYCVELDRLCRLVADRLEERGVHYWRDTRLTGLENSDRKWILQLSAKGDDEPSLLRADTVVLAFGRACAAWFPDLAVEERGGELLVTTREPSPPLSVGVLGGGHVIPRFDGRVVAGSTWWSADQSHARTDSQARESILEKCAGLSSSLHAADGNIWRGVRVQFGDHQPLAGPVPGRDNLHVLSAFGGTGLFSIPLYARELARTLLDRGGRLPSLGRADRMGADNWRFDEQVIIPSPL